MKHIEFTRNYSDHSTEHGAESIRSAQWQQAKDKAFMEAVEQIKPSFLQCPRCLSWVCKKNCWNQTRGLCKNCAPDLAVEISAQQSAKAVEKIYADVTADADDSRLVSSVGDKKVAASCQAATPHCQAMPSSARNAVTNWPTPKSSAPSAARS